MSSFTFTIFFLGNNYGECQVTNPNKSQHSTKHNKLEAEFCPLVRLLLVETESADQYPAVGNMWKSKLTGNL